MLPTFWTFFGPFLIKYGMDVHERLLSNYKFCNNQHNKSCTLLGGINQFTAIFSTFVSFMKIGTLDIYMYADILLSI